MIVDDKNISIYNDIYNPSNTLANDKYNIVMNVYDC